MQMSIFESDEEYIMEIIHKFWKYFENTLLWITKFGNIIHTAPSSWAI